METSITIPIISGVSALTRYYFQEGKNTLMKSKVFYNINVKIKQKNVQKKLISFSKLSRLCVVLNTFNALLLAEQIS